MTAGAGRVTGATRGRRRVLYLDANGTGKVVVTADTVLRGILGLGDGARPPKWLARYRSVRDLYAHLRQFHESLSYVTDWRDAFVKSPGLDVEVCNINNLVHLGNCLVRIRRYDLVVVSHAAAGDDLSLLLRVAGGLARRDCPLVMFIGNEYDLLADKLAFIERVRADRVCSQLPLAAARYLYGDHDWVLSVPHALNPDVYRPPEAEARHVDVGFVGDIYWPFVGDDERTRLIRHFERLGEAYGLRCDIGVGRMARSEWARFLRGCAGTIGAESGTYFLNERGALLERARHYNLHVHREATFDEVYDRFYRGVTPTVSGKSISSRHFEPVGTMTCQILLDGEYNGVLVPGEHYIAVRRDLSNLDEVVREFKDASRRRELTQRAYEHVLSGHTYAHRVAGVLGTLF